MNYAKTKKKITIKRYTYDFLLIIIGCSIMAFGTSLFLLPNQLSTGGFSGIATISYYLLNTPLGTTILILNIPLLILGYFRIGKVFLIKALSGTVILAVFIDLFDRLPTLTDDRFLACIYGGIAIGLGTSLILKAEASTGGTDLLTYIIRSYKPHYQAGTLIVIIDIIIVGLNVIFFRDIEIGLYSAIAIFLMGKMIDMVFEGIDFTKMMFIISDKYEEIAKEVGDKIDRGSTGIYAKGMYTDKEKMMLLCVGSRGDIAKTKKIALEIDNKAFIIISNAREAFGKGFKKE